MAGRVKSGSLVPRDDVKGKVKVKVKSRSLQSLSMNSDFGHVSKNCRVRMPGEVALAIFRASLTFQNREIWPFIEFMDKLLQDDVSVGLSLLSYGVSETGRRFHFCDQRASDRAAGAIGLWLPLLRGGSRSGWRRGDNPRGGAGTTRALR